MPYISTERMTKIRSTIKNDFPGWTFSIRKDGSSTVVITVLTAPYNLLPEHNTAGYFGNINHYTLINYFQGQALIDMQHIRDIVMEGNGGFEDGDYGFVPNWYFDLNIGNSDQPFRVDNTPVAPPKNPTVFNGGIRIDDIQILQYSEKSFVVTGEGTKAFKKELAELGGRFNGFLTHPETKEKFKG